MDEKKLIEALRRHSEAAISEIIEKYTPYVSAIIYNVSRGLLSAEDIEETTADTFYTLWKNTEKVREGALKGYLAAIAKSRAKDRLRSLPKSEIVNIDDAELRDEYSISDNIDRETLSKDIRDSLEFFKQPDKEIMIRYYYYYQTVAEIADILQLNKESVKSKLRRAKTKLRALLEERGYNNENR